MAEPTLDAAMAEIANLQESLAELEQLAREDRGWDLMIGQAEQDMTPDGRRRISDLCEVMTIANPLIKRGFRLRHSYVWGAGHTISVETSKADKDGAVNAAVQRVLDDPRNAASLRSEDAVEQLERWLYTHGAIVLLLHTEDDGAVVVRQEDPDHIVDHITDPEDAKTVWYWKRQYQTRNLRKDGTAGAVKTVTVWHPDVDYSPAGDDRLETIGRHGVRWDQPLLIRSVNTPARAGWTWGIPDAYAAVPWARMSKEFLEAWFVLMKALSRYAWRTQSKSRTAARTIAAREAAAIAANPTGAGATAAMDRDTTLEAVPKSGATIDASSALPLQQFVAAALDVPLTMLLGDPGISGSRAIAETLDQPMELAMGARRRFWGEVLTRLCHHAIDAAVEAGKLTGTVVKVDGRRTVTLPDGWSRTVHVDWPDYDSVPLDVAMKALRDADGLDKLPAELIIRLALKALDVDNPDEWLDKMRDADGNLVPEVERAAQAAAEAARQNVRP